MPSPVVEKVVILDAGAQYGAVIDRRCREAGVDSDVRPLDSSAKHIKVRLPYLVSYSCTVSEADSLIVSVVGCHLVKHKQSKGAHYTPIPYCTQVCTVVRTVRDVL